MLEKLFISIYLLYFLDIKELGLSLRQSVFSEE